MSGEEIRSECPVCTRGFDRESEQGICIETFDECIVCRFEPDGVGSGSGTWKDLDAIRKEWAIRNEEEPDTTNSARKETETQNQCPECKLVWNHDLEYQCCIEMYGECLNCRFNDWFHTGSNSGTKEEADQINRASVLRKKELEKEPVIVPNRYAEMDALESATLGRITILGGQGGIDPRLLSIARTQIELGFLAARKAMKVRDPS